MNKHVKVFLEQSFEPYSFNELLKKFLKKQIKKQKSDAHVYHQWRSLYALGGYLNNPQIKAVKTKEIKNYIDELWLKYSRGTITPIIGDIKQFFKWLKKKRHLKRDKAKEIRRPKRKPGRIKSAPEDNVKAVAALLATQLKNKNLVYRDFFGVLVGEPANRWKKENLHAIRDLFILSFLYETGARAKELSNLGRVAMEKICRDRQAVYKVTCGVGKTDDRDYYFTNATAEIWHIWNCVRPDIDNKYAVAGLHNGSFAKQLRTNGISQILVRRCEQLHIKPFRSHSLRHAKGRRSRQLVGLEMTNRLLDHSSLKTTQEYTNIDDIELANAVRLTGIQIDFF